MDKPRFKVGDLGIYIAARGSTQLMHLGTVVRVLFRGDFKRGDTVQVGGSLRWLTQPADYVVASLADPEVTAGLREWQLAAFGNPDDGGGIVRTLARRLHKSGDPS
jgi:hypothetical protein